MLMSVFVQNIVDMIVDSALWVADRKKEFSKIIEGRLYQGARWTKTVVAISERADEVCFVLESWSEGIPFRVETSENFFR